MIPKDHGGRGVPRNYLVISQNGSARGPKLCSAGRVGDPSLHGRLFYWRTGEGARATLATPSECGAGAEQAVQQDYQDDAGEDHVHAIVLGGESPDGEGNADDGGGDQQEQSELDDAAAVESEGVADDSAYAFEVGGFAAKYPVICRLAAMPGQINDCAKGDHEGGE